VDGALAVEVPVGATGDVLVGIRPEDLEVTEVGDLQIDVQIVEELGAIRLMHGQIAGQDISVAVPKDQACQTGPVSLRLKTAPHLFDAQSGRRL
jgi:sn-glycerol 3-phosphate transport system ATP-binding protein